MLCDSCKKADAVVHLTKIENGKRTELHLCAACAEKEGILINGKDIEAWGNNFFGKTATGDDEVTVTSEVTCPECGMTFADFNRTGLFGCSACYTAFSEEIQPVLRRIHGHVRQGGSCLRYGGISDKGPYKETAPGIKAHGGSRKLRRGCADSR